MVTRVLPFTILGTIISAFAASEVVQTRALLCGVLAAAMLGVAIFAPSSALVRITRLLGPALILALAIPAIWMVLQIIPVPMHGLGNPIWASTSAALNEPLAERVTVDLPATVQSLAQYGAVIAVALLTAVVGLDKVRAAQLLRSLMVVGAIFSMASLWAHGESAAAAANGAVPTVLGLLLSTAMLVRTADQIQRARRASGLGIRRAELSLALIATLICLGAILVRDTTSITIAGLLGTGVLLAVVAIRRWFGGIWGTMGVLGTGAVVLLAGFTLLPMKTSSDWTILLSAQDQGATERMLQDTSLAGSGAGTYTALLPLHRDLGPIAQRERPTAAAAIAVEMGRAFLGALLFTAAISACILFRQSLLRGQDYVYAATGAGASVSLAILVLVEDGILGLGASLLAAALYGLALAQSQSSTASEIVHLGSLQSAGGVNAQSVMMLPAHTNRRIRVALACVAVALIAASMWLLTHRSYLGDFEVRRPAADGTLAEMTFRTTGSFLGQENSMRTEKYSTQVNADGRGTELLNQQGATDAKARGITDALRYSPLRGDLWLLLAAALREYKEYKMTTFDLLATLKLAYYTAPNNLDLLPLRLSVALGTNLAVNEPELRELIKRDVRIGVTIRPALRPAVAAAYRSASIDGKRFAESVISELDPRYLQNVRAQRP